MNHRVKIISSAGSWKSRFSLPFSKSISNRILIIRALCGGVFQIRNLSTAGDTVLLERLLNTDQRVLDSGNAGTVFRFLTAYAALRLPGRIISGNERLRQRPVAPLVNALRTLGAEIEYTEKEGFAPLRIRKKINMGGKVIIDAGKSSQFISALLLIAPMLSGGLKIVTKGPKVSEPYIEMTCKLMERFGISVERGQGFFNVPQQNYQPSTVSVESDWSSAAFWYELVALSPGSEGILEGLHLNGIQGDERTADIYAILGVRSEEVPEGIRIQKMHGTNYPESIELDFRNHPDLFLPVASTLTALKISARLKGLETLHDKESDRIQMFLKGITLLGGKYILESGGVLRLIPSDLHSAPDTIPVMEDHRVAMAFASLSPVISPLMIDNPVSVDKSYPGFWENLKHTGYQLEFF
ncbi:MAG: 3-phosphoshikimate 1-carboxyvinyltransferase [Bacteroidia bacterium]|nr:3-phosphoshikimate 1-carboxyvinyltransferase [Bacteroidia bacterium]